MTSKWWERAWKSSLPALKNKRIKVENTPLHLHACVANQKRVWVPWTNTHTHKVHTLYLFDIVACLCTCFNKQNIHLFRSLFSLLCGYLSVMTHRTQSTQTSTRTHHTHHNGQQQEDRGEKYRLWLCWSGFRRRAPSCCCCHMCSRPKDIQ